MPLSDLQAIIDATQARSGVLGAPADAAWAQRLLNDSWAVTLASIRDNGTPHAAVTFAACLDGAIYLAARDRTVLAHNLRSRPAVAISCVGARWDSIMALGQVESAGAWSDLNDSFRASLNNCKPDSEFLDPDWPGTIHRFTPDSFTVVAG